VAQASGNTQAATAMASGRVEARGDGIGIAVVIATRGGRCPLSIMAAATEAAAGEVEEARLTTVRRTRTLQMRPPGGGGSRNYMWREEQIEQFAYLIRSREKKRHWLRNNDKFKDTRDPTMAVAVDGNEDDGKNNGDNDDDRGTSSAWSNFIVRNLFHRLLLLA
jgi:hypothetical protein